MPWPAARDVPVPTGRSVLLGVRGVPHGAGPVCSAILMVQGCIFVLKSPPVVRLGLSYPVDTFRPD